VPTIIWNETVGNYLDEIQSSWLPIDVAPWNPDNAYIEIGLRVSFAFQKFSGNNITILCMDKGQLTCEHKGPFPETSAPPSIDPSEDTSGFKILIIILIVIIVAIVVGLTIMLKRKPKIPPPPQYPQPPYGQ
jgi:hypothetical protein